MGHTFVICYIRANYSMHGHILAFNQVGGVHKKNPLSGTGGCLLSNELGAPLGHGKIKGWKCQ